MPPAAERDLRYCVTCRRPVIEFTGTGLKSKLRMLPGTTKIGSRLSVRGGYAYECDACRALPK